jgi:5'-phosphate synthase pdxT subunit
VTPKVGVLSVQGDFARHRATLEAAGAEAVRVTLPSHLEGLDALVLPGGESTTMLRLIESSGLRAPLERFVRTRPVLGTCAGVILLGRGGQGLPAPTLGVLDVGVERNAYGRQIDSFEEAVDAPEVADRFPGVYIRAPRLTRIGRGVQVVARRPAGGDKPGEPVGVRQGRVVGLCFHPEMTDDPSFHRWFLSEVAGLGRRAGAERPVRTPARKSVRRPRVAAVTRGARRAGARA